MGRAMHATIRKHEQQQAEGSLKRAGYKVGGMVHSEVGERAVDDASDKKLIRKALRQHENAEHGGEHHALDLKAGGKVKGAKSKHRGPTIINIKTGDGAGRRQAAEAGIRKGVGIGAQLGARAVANKLATAGAPPAGGLGAAPPAPGPMAGPAPGPVAPRPAIAPAPGPMAVGGSVHVRPHFRRRSGGAV